jgi:hypothetical protein
MRGRRHQEAIDNADAIKSVRAVLTAPERTTAISTAANAQAASPLNAGSPEARVNGARKLTTGRR